MDKHGIYYSASMECFVLFIYNSWQVMSVVRQDCIDKAKELGYIFN